MIIKLLVLFTLYSTTFFGIAHIIETTKPEAPVIFLAGAVYMACMIIITLIIADA